MMSFDLSNQIQSNDCLRQDSIGLLRLVERALGLGVGLQEVSNVAVISCAFNATLSTGATEMCCHLLQRMPFPGTGIVPFRFVGVQLLASKQPTFIVIKQPTNVEDNLNLKVFVLGMLGQRSFLILLSVNGCFSFPTANEELDSFYMKMRDFYFTHRFCDGLCGLRVVCHSYQPTNVCLSKPCFSCGVVRASILYNQLLVDFYLFFSPSFASSA